MLTERRVTAIYVCMLCVYVYVRVMRVARRCMSAPRLVVPVSGLFMSLGQARALLVSVRA
jgi:hypothetical protein